MSSHVWIRTDPSPDGSTYIVAVEVTDDVSFPLDWDAATAYVRYVLDAAERAEYDAAVSQQMQRRLKLDVKTAAQVVVDLRDDRPPLKEAWPLVLTPGVSAFTGEPFLTIGLTGGKKLGQWTVADARSHATFVLSAVVVADLDAGYYRELVGVVGVDDGTARAVIGNLGEHRSNGEGGRP